jgi:hypothetical protein
MRAFASTILNIFLSSMLGGVFFLITTVFLAADFILASLFPLRVYLLSGWVQSFLSWSMILCLNAPIFFILTLWLAAIFKKKRFTIRKKGVYYLTVFFSISIISGLLLIMSLINSYKDIALVKNTDFAMQQPFEKIILKVKKNENRFYTWWYQTNRYKTVQKMAITINNVKIKLFMSKDELYHISLIRCANGKNKNEATENAQAIDYKVNQQDSIVWLDSGFELYPGRKLRNQGVIVLVEIPIGRTIVIDESVNRSLYWIHHNFTGKPDIIEQEIAKESFTSYETNVAYVMKTNGLQLIK